VLERKRCVAGRCGVREGSVRGAGGMWEGGGTGEPEGCYL